MNQTACAAASPLPSLQGQCDINCCCALRPPRCTRRFSPFFLGDRWVCTLPHPKLSHLSCEYQNTRVQPLNGFHLHGQFPVEPAKQSESARGTQVVLRIWSGCDPDCDSLGTLKDSFNCLPEGESHPVRAEGIMRTPSLGVVAHVRYASLPESHLAIFLSIHLSLWISELYTRLGAGPTTCSLRGPQLIRVLTPR